MISLKKTQALDYKGYKQFVDSNIDKGMKVMEEEKEKSLEKIKPFQSHFKTCLRITASIDEVKASDWRNSLKISSKEDGNTVNNSFPKSVKVYINIFENEEYSY